MSEQKELFELLDKCKTLMQQANEDIHSFRQYVKTNNRAECRNQLRWIETLASMLIKQS